VINMARKPLSYRLIKKKSDFRDQHSSKADGASLELGSSEYNEYIRDKNDMNEHEQERDKLADGGYLQVDERLVHRDDFHLEREEKLAKEPSTRVQEFIESGEGRLNRAEIQSRSRMEKILAGVKLEHELQRCAAQTETREDDNFVKREIPKLVKEKVEDNQASVEDIYPGMRALEKYM